MRWLTLLILFLVTVGYLFIGAAVFQALESQNEQDSKTFSEDRIQRFLDGNIFEPRHDKTSKMAVCPAKTHISQSIRPVWSAQSDQSSLSAWRHLGSSATHWAHSEDSDQTGRMPRLIWVFAGRTLILLVLSCCDSIFVFLTGHAWHRCFD